MTVLGVSHDVGGLRRLGVVRAAEIADDRAVPVVVVGLSDERGPSAVRAGVATGRQRADTAAEQMPLEVRLGDALETKKHPVAFAPGRTHPAW